MNGKIDKNTVTVTFDIDENGGRLSASQKNLTVAFQKAVVGKLPNGQPLTVQVTAYYPAS